MIYTSFIHHLYIIYTWFIHHLYIIFTWFIHHLYIIYTSFIHYLYIHKFAKNIFQTVPGFQLFWEKKNHGCVVSGSMVRFCKKFRRFCQIHCVLWADQWFAGFLQFTVENLPPNNACRFSCIKIRLALTFPVRTGVVSWLPKKW